MTETFDFPRELRCDGVMLDQTHPYTADMLRRAAVEIEHLHRRVKVLETVIREELIPIYCDSELNRMIVEGLHEKTSLSKTQCEEQ